MNPLELQVLVLVSRVPESSAGSVLATTGPRPPFDAMLARSGAAGARVPVRPS